MDNIQELINNLAERIIYIDEKLEKSTIDEEIFNLNIEHEFVFELYLHLVLKYNVSYTGKVIKKEVQL